MIYMSFYLGVVYTRRRSVPRVGSESRPRRVGTKEVNRLIFFFFFFFRTFVSYLITGVVLFGFDGFRKEPIADEIRFRKSACQEQRATLIFLFCFHCHWFKGRVWITFMMFNIFWDFGRFEFFMSTWTLLICLRLMSLRSWKRKGRHQW